MTPSQKIKQLALYALDLQKLDYPSQIEKRFDDILNGDEGQEVKDRLNEIVEELRSGVYNTDLPTNSCRHYECREVAAGMLDGSFVGWTYWYGGGKYGAPESVPWIDKAYEVAYEEVKTVVRKWRRVEQTP